MAHPRSLIGFPLIVLLAAFALLFAVRDAAALGPFEPVEGLLVFHCSPGPGFDICSDSPEGDNWMALTNDSTSDSSPALSPDGQQIVWERDLLDLWIMDSDGGNQHELLADVFSNFDSPTWSPDGEMIGFICSEPGNLNNDGICVMDRAGTDFEMIEDQLDPRPEHLEWNPVFPDLMLLEIETNSINEDIFVYEISTGQMTNITNTPDEWEHGTWSPDGMTIAFAGTPLASETTSTGGFYKINPDGSGRTNLYTPTQGVTATNPAWSPDGMEIAGICNQRSICVVSPDGGLVREMVEDNPDEYYLGADMDWGYTSGPIFGDLDCDGDVDVNDGLLALQGVAGTDGTGCLPFGATYSLNGEAAEWGDLNCDGVADIKDALVPFLYTAQLPAGQEEGCPPPGHIADIATS